MDQRKQAGGASHSAWSAAAPALGVVAAAAAFALASWLMLDTPHEARLMAEGSPVEESTPLLYFFVAAAIWCTRRPGIEARTSTALALVLAFFGAREMDLHKAFTGMSVLKLRFYMTDASLTSKFVALLFLAVFAAAVGYLLRTQLPKLPAALRRADPMASTFAVFMVTLVVSKILDRSVNILREDYGLAIAPSIAVLALSMEETLELALPLLACLGLWQSRRPERVSAATASAGRPSAAP